ncbi:hypothetical protein AVEN_16870-1 [Araneus ventricosus]|uniref:Uncharacterized protein n=1 Tax=Araneus ventricosus TaxID=182803 RepID=A0A4Y2WMR3_ARAVE|nr:hypothetical protein AVEN_16870-1 [Araneus ventricosus]
MADFNEQCTVVKFCFLLWKNATETVVMLKTAYKDDPLGKTEVYELFSCFKNFDMSTDHKPHSVCHSTACQTKVSRKFMLEDQQQTIQHIVEVTGLSWFSEF